MTKSICGVSHDLSRYLDQLDYEDALAQAIDEEVESLSEREKQDVLLSIGFKLELAEIEAAENNEQLGDIFWRAYEKELREVALEKIEERAYEY